MADVQVPFDGRTGIPFSERLQAATRRHVPPVQGGQQDFAQVHYAQGYQAHPHVPPQTGPVARAVGLTQIAGALVSLALLAGICVWGYQLIMRDVTGIPVVRAAEGPMRVAPANPGGSITAHQGLAVNEVAGRGAASGPADRLVLAPTPVDLTLEDAPARPDPLTAAGAEAAEPAASLQDATIQAMADQIAATTAPREAPAPATEATDGLDPDALSRAIDPVILALDPTARSLRPQPRPAALRSASLQPISASAPADAGIIPATLAPGARLVQLGAYDSAEIAEREWARISGQFDTFFIDKQRVIEQAQSGGRTFFRLRAAGFADLAEARRFCAALVSEQTECIPVATR